MTKYDMSLVMADAFDLPASHIQPDSQPSSGAKRPYNAHLGSGRLEQFGICHRRPFKQAIKDCLAPFFQKGNVQS